jgi:hypothetical protein
MLRRGAFAALVIALAMSVQARADDDDELREDVLTCEDALARLAGCCPGFDATKVECHYHRHESDGGCGYTPTYDNEDPAFTLDESRCIRDTSCDMLVRGHVCERAQSAAARIERGGGEPIGGYGYDAGYSSSGGCNGSGSSASSTSSGGRDAVKRTALDLGEPVCP